MNSDFSFEQIRQLVGALQKNNWEKEDLTRLAQCGQKKSDDIRTYLEDKANLVLKVLSLEFIEVDRSVPPLPNEYEITFRFPGLQNTDPSQIPVSQITLPINSGVKKDAPPMSESIYDVKFSMDLKSLMKGDVPQDGLNKRDLDEIQSKGVPFFNKYLKGKILFAWKSIGRDGVGSVVVPYLEVVPFYDIRRQRNSWEVQSSFLSFSSDFFI